MRHRVKYTEVTETWNAGRKGLDLVGKSWQFDCSTCGQFKTGYDTKENAIRGHKTHVRFEQKRAEVTQ